MIKSRFLSFSLILGTGFFLLLVSLVISAGLAAVGKYSSRLFPDMEIMLQVGSALISLIVITILFAMIYKLLPKVKVAWKDVWAGAFLATVLFSLGKSLHWQKRRGFDLWRCWFARRHFDLGIFFGPGIFAWCRVHAGLFSSARFTPSRIKA